jgi:hypothetical protein
VFVNQIVGNEWAPQPQQYRPPIVLAAEFPDAPGKTQFEVRWADANPLNPPFRHIPAPSYDRRERIANSIRAEAKT